MGGDNVIPFAKGLPPGAVHVVRVFNSTDDLQAYVASALAISGPEVAGIELCASALDHLRGQASLGVDGGVEVSAAGLNLVLGYLAYLEQLAGLAPLGGACGGR